MWAAWKGAHVGVLGVFLTFVITHIPSRSRTCCLNLSVWGVVAFDKARKYEHSLFTLILPVLPFSNYVTAWETVTYLLIGCRKFQEGQPERTESERPWSLYVRRYMTIRSESVLQSSVEGPFGWRKDSTLGHRSQFHQRWKKTSRNCALLIVALREFTEKLLRVLAGKVQNTSEAVWRKL